MNRAGGSQHGEYGDAVEETDWVIGQVMKTLDEQGLTQHTLLYFSSDHGGDKADADLHGRPTGGWNGVFRGAYTCVGTYLEPMSKCRR